jgi:hypothetical protein
MKEYYKIQYLSSDYFYLAVKDSSNNLEIMNSAISPEKLKISVNSSGQIVTPKYFRKPKSISEDEAKKLSHEFRVNNLIKTLNLNF